MTECLNLLKHVYEGTCMFRAMVLMRHKRFLKARDAVENEKRERRFSILKTNENIAEIIEIIRKDGRVTLQNLGEPVIKNAQI